MNSIARTCSRLLGIGVGAAIGGPLVGAASGVLGDALQDLVGDAFGDNPDFRSDITALLGNITASAFPSLFSPLPDYKDFNHDFRRSLLQALIKALRGEVPTTYASTVGWSEAKHDLIRRCLKAPADHIERQLKHALKKGEKSTFDALFPPGAVDKTLLDLQDDSADTALVGDLLGQWYDSVIAPVIAAECARDLPYLGGAEEFRRQTLAALANEFPAAFASLLKEDKNQRLRIATDRLLTNATRQLLAQLPTQISGLDEKLTQIGDSLTTQLNRLEGKIDDLTDGQKEILAGQKEQSAKLEMIMQAYAELQKRIDPETDPISKWPKERLEQELAQQMDMSVDDLCAIITAGKTSLDALLQGQALLASGQVEAAGEKFDIVIQEERAALQRLRQAYEGKAQIAWDAVRYEEALDYRQKAAALVDKDIDPLGWCDAQVEVASIYHHLARYQEAEPLLREILRLREQFLGQDHPNVATDLNNLAQLLKETNRLAEAESLMRRVVTMFEEACGKDHPKVGIALGNLAALLLATNRLEEAEPLMRRALKIAEASFGPDHPEVANAINNLAQLLQAMNRLAEAEPLMRRALKIDEASFGADHPEVAIDLNNLASLLKATNRLAEAEPLMRRALEIDKASYGPGHPRMAIDLNNLAQLLQATNRLAEAEPLMWRALEIDEGSYGPDHPKVAIRLNNLASLLKATNRLEEAEPLMRRALEIDEASYGPGHPRVAIDLNNLAQLLQATDRLAEAEPLMWRALEIDEGSYGPDHPKVAVRLNNLARLLQTTNRLAEAEHLSRRHLEIFVLFQKQTGHEHPHFRAAVGNYVGLLKEMKLSEEEIRRRLGEIGVVEE